MNDEGSKIILFNSIISKVQQFSPKTPSTCVRLGRAQQFSLKTPSACVRPGRTWHLPPEKLSTSDKHAETTRSVVKQRMLWNHAEQIVLGLVLAINVAKIVANQSRSTTVTIKRLSLPLL